MSHPSKFVDVYQWSNKTIYQIPADELAPGMIEVHFAHLGRTCWTEASKVCTQARLGAFRWPPFGPALRKKIGLIKKRLCKVYPLTFKEWEDGFRRDRFPEMEITLWLRLSEEYATRVSLHRLNSAQSKELFHVLLQCLNGTGDHVMQTVQLKKFPRELAQQAVDGYFERRALEEAAACAEAGSLTGIPGHVASPVRSLNDPAVREEVQNTAVVLGIDAATKNINVFFGEEVLRGVVSQEVFKPLPIISFLYDSRTDELEHLYAAVRHLKGSCCYRAEAQP